MKFKKSIKHYVIGLIVIILLRIFVLEIYIIPSDSMFPSILKGDIVVVNKLTYGPRMILGDKTYRMFKMRSPIANDILVFNFPEGDTVYAQHPEVNYYRNGRLKGKDNAVADTFYLGKLVRNRLQYIQPFIKRLVAVPGDTFLIRDGHIGTFAERNYVEYDSLLRPELGIKRDFVSDIFPYSKNHCWSFTHFGPLVTPGKDREISLTHYNLPLYRKIIETYEDNKLSSQGGDIYINGEKALSYKFKQNYYFMKGDNRYNSYDSRFWGFLPEDYIVGRAELILFSLDPEREGLKKIRWDRFFKLL